MPHIIFLVRLELHPFAQVLKDSFLYLHKLQPGILKNTVL